MGIPYSKQINAAFEEVTPLVASGFQVLQTTLNITFLLAEIQVLTVLILFCVLVVLCLLLVTCNPDLERERQVLVTPVVRWMVGWIVSKEGKVRVWLAGVVVVGGVVAVGYGHYLAYFRQQQQQEEEKKVVEEGDGGVGREGRDVDGIKEGKAVQ